MPTADGNRVTFNLVLQDEVALPLLKGWNVSRRLTLVMERAQDNHGAVDDTISVTLDPPSATDADST